MRRLVLADTGPLYAALDPDDGHHRRAQAEIGALASSTLGVAILYSTLLEAYTLVLHRMGVVTAHGWLAEVTAGAVLLNPSTEDYAAGQETVATFADQPITLVDGVLAAASRRLGLAVWTYDHHFDLVRASVWRG